MLDHCGEMIRISPQEIFPSCIAAHLIALVLELFRTLFRLLSIIGLSGVLLKST